MGRETVAVARWRGAVEEVKALLESTEIILRGAIKARIARSNISDIAVAGEELVLRCAGEPLVLELGATEAQKWRDALLKPPPSLASKLGIEPDRPAFLIGSCDDEALNHALTGAVCALPGEAHVLVAIIEREPDLAAALAMAEHHLGLSLWCVYGKGKTAKFGDTQVRAFMRGRGYVDTKSCAVSDRLTAARYQRKVAD